MEVIETLEKFDQNGKRIGRKKSHSVGTISYASMLKAIAEGFYKKHEPGALAHLRVSKLNKISESKYEIRIEPALVFEPTIVLTYEIK